MELNELGKLELGGLGTYMKQIASAFAASVIALAMIFFVHHLIDLGKTESDREIVLALEGSAVVIIFALILGREALEVIVTVLREINSRKTMKHAGEWRSVMILLATVFVSLAIYFGFTKYVQPL